MKEDKDKDKDKNKDKDKVSSACYTTPIEFPT